MTKKHQKLLVWLIWLLLVVLWNFGVPGALPIYDVLVSVGLSLVVIFVNRYVQDKNEKM